MNQAEFEEFKKTFGEDFAEYGGDSVKKGMSTGDFLPHINKWRKWPYGRQYNFYASDSDKCPRNMFYMMWNIPESNPDITDMANNNFDIGYMVEAHIVEKYRKLRGTMWEQSRCSFNLLDDPVFKQQLTDLPAEDRGFGVDIMNMFMPRISGNMDIVFDDLSKVFNKKVKRYIIEVKSIKDWPFASHTRQGEKEPYMIGADMVTPEGYYLQLCNYLYLNQVEDGMLHLFNKNNGSERVWNVTLEAATHAMENVVLPRFKSWYIAYLKKELPDRPYEGKISKDGTRLLKADTYWKCLYCSRSSLCWQLDGITEQPEFGVNNEPTQKHKKEPIGRKTGKEGGGRRKRSRRAKG